MGCVAPALSGLKPFWRVVAVGGTLAAAKGNGLVLRVVNAATVSVPTLVPATLTVPVSAVVVGWISVALIELYAQLSVVRVAVPCAAESGMLTRPEPTKFSRRSLLTWA